MCALVAVADCSLACAWAADAHDARSSSHVWLLTGLRMGYCALLKPWLAAHWPAYGLLMLMMRALLATDGCSLACAWAAGAHDARSCSRGWLLCAWAAGAHDARSCSHGWLRTSPDDSRWCSCCALLKPWLTALLKPWLADWPAYGLMVLMMRALLAMAGCSLACAWAAGSHDVCSCSHGWLLTGLRVGCWCS